MVTRPSIKLTSLLAQPGVDANDLDLATEAVDADVAASAAAAPAAWPQALGPVDPPDGRDARRREPAGGGSLPGLSLQRPAAAFGQLAEPAPWPSLAYAYDAQAIEAFLQDQGIGLFVALGLGEDLLGPSQDLPTKRLERAFAALDRVLRAAEYGGISASVALNGFLRRANTAYGQASYAHNTSANRVELGTDRPYLLAAHPGELPRVGAWLESLWQQQTRVVVALAPPTWLEAASRSSAGVALETAGQWAPFGPTGSQVPAIAALPCTLVYKGERRALTVVRVAWPDFQPLAPEVLQALVAAVDRERAGGALAVHCQAGLGRTGTFALAHALGNRPGPHKPLTLLAALQTLLRLRLQRACSVETGPQFAAAVRSAGRDFAER